MTWLDIKGAVTADTVYADGQLVAKNVAFTLPAITLLTAEVQAMGTMSVPVMGLLEHMEATVTKIGIDKGLSRISRMTKQNLEFRWIQNVVKEGGIMDIEGCRAFITALPASVPSLGIEVGSATEGEITFGVTRVQIFVGGEELLLVDRLAQILRINGVDHMGSINSLL